ncbi:unnamed protein product [Adineta ricciae]|uniref:HTH CENPB-type domain-containing protein n=1 Tax=Adineta ricciae TaxID=249248 RepID=A0A815UMA0_ADIRI|nr:unnamed protein product [Adineta ricciae]
MEKDHLLPLPPSSIESTDDESDFAVDSDDEIIENVIQMLDNVMDITNLTDESQDEAEEQSPIGLSKSSISDPAPVVSQPKNSSVGNDKSFQNASSKRRSWTVKEKLIAIKYFKQCKNISEVCWHRHCDRKQLRQWLKNEAQLVLLMKENNGKNLKRMKGRGAKIRYQELDRQLIQWFKSKRTKTNDEQSNEPIEIKKERITFKNLVRQGEKISVSLKIQPYPSQKWFRRFMKRHRLSLQKPKRQQKISLVEAHCRATEFLTFVRKSASRVLNIGVLGSFPDRDICNMDESPLALFGDQSKASINYMNTPNEVEGCLDNKRFCTLVLTVFGEDNRVAPVLIFKGKGQVFEREKKYYDKDIKVYFSPTAYMNSSIMKSYSEYWFSKTRDGRPKMIVTDSCKSHLTEEVKNSFKRNGVVLGIIPGGITQYIQVLDVFVFSVYKTHYCDAAEEWIEVNGPRSSIKLSSSQQRILCTRLASTAWKRTLGSVNFSQSFRDLGYTWNDKSIVTIKSLPGYSFDPESIDSEEYVENASSLIEKVDEIIDMQPIKALKQGTLLSFWKK